MRQKAVVMGRRAARKVAVRVLGGDMMLLWVRVQLDPVSTGLECEKRVVKLSKRTAQDPAGKTDKEWQCCQSTIKRATNDRKRTTTWRRERSTDHEYVAHSSILS